MKSRKELLKESHLYLIIDKKTSGKNDVSEIAGRLRYCGVDILQFRDKFSRKDSIIKDAFLLRKALLRTKILFIVNDYPDVAKIADSDGLHIGQEDISLKIARRILGAKKIIGVSCHNLKQAIAAQKEGADYIGIGPLFPTPTKPEYKPIGLSVIDSIIQEIRIPFFVIGDVNLDNIDKVILSGAKRVAVCRAILKARNPIFAARKFSGILNQ